MVSQNHSLTQPLSAELTALCEEFQCAVKLNVPMDKYTSTRVGGTADVLILTKNADELAKVIVRLWDMDLPYVLLGGCSNILVSDRGIREVVIINRARGLGSVKFDMESDPPVIHADAAVNFGLLARKAGQLGLSGLEWASGIPGTLGGAIVGNAGAHGGEIAGNLLMADILQRNRNGQNQLPSIASWTNEQFEFKYRSSVLKKMSNEAIVLNGVLQVSIQDTNIIQKKSKTQMDYRKRTQPPGASMGSIFKNPSGDYAGRLIEQAGLKGAQIGGAQISPLHANFFINTGKAKAIDIYNLIRLAQNSVLEKFGILLELEIELVGDWQ